MAITPGEYDITVTTEGVGDKADCPDVIIQVGRIETYIVIGAHHVSIKPEDWAAVMAYAATRQAKFARERARGEGR